MSTHCSDNYFPSTMKFSCVECACLSPSPGVSTGLTQGEAGEVCDVSVEWGIDPVPRKETFKFLSCFKPELEQVVRGFHSMEFLS